MVSNLKLISFLLLALVGVTGCSTVGTVLNPYDEHFHCKTSDSAGNCIDTPGAYDDAKGITPLGNNKGEIVKNGKNGECFNCTSEEKVKRAAAASHLANWEAPKPPVQKGAAAYQDAQFQKLADLLEKPQAPIMQPPKMMRVLILSYQSQDALFMPRYTFIRVEDASWVFGSDVQVPEDMD